MTENEFTGIPIRPREEVENEANQIAEDEKAQMDEFSKSLESIPKADNEE